jgi:hypothetical protein
VDNKFDLQVATFAMQNQCDTTYVHPSVSICVCHLQKTSSGSLKNLKSLAKEECLKLAFINIEVRYNM